MLGWRVDSLPSRIGLLSFQVASQFCAANGMAQLAQRLGLNLADALAGERLAAPGRRQDLRRLIQRMPAAVAQAVAHVDHLPLTLIKRRQRLVDVVTEQ